MKIIKYLFVLVCIGLLPACNKLNVPPMNIIQDQDIFNSVNGITAYMARMYSQLPVEDFKYSTDHGFNNWNIIKSVNTFSGEGINKNVTGLTNGNTGYWADAYTLIREADYFLQTLPKYSANFNNNQAQLNQWAGEARFIRAYTYFALVKRYGGVPVIDSVQYYPGEGLDKLQVPRNSEEEVYDYIAKDCDFAIQNMGETSEQRGRANKYVAAALKSTAMLFAGSIAKYNAIQLFDGATGKRLCGIPTAKADSFFKASYDASMLLNGHYSLYRTNPDKYQDYVNLFFDDNSPENIFVKYYHYPDVVHSYDAVEIPYQEVGGNGYSSYLNPTLNFVELFDGLPKNPDGTLQTKDANGKYILYKHRMDLFANAEPRLMATVIVPGAIYRGQQIDVRRGIYTGPVSSGISALIPEGYTGKYPTSGLVTSSSNIQTPYTLPNGTKMNPAGLSGIFTGQPHTVTGFYIRKYMDSTKTQASMLLHHSDQHWIDMRYAEILLNRAEAAYELYSDGYGANYLQDAYNCINDIRDRAGATLLTGPASLTSDTIRIERKKELAFENKIWWDIKRWRVADNEINNKTYRMLNPFYSSNASEYFFDARLDERNIRFTFNPTWYYEPIPGGELTKDPKLLQNPGY